MLVVGLLFAGSLTAAELRFSSINFNLHRMNGVPISNSAADAGSDGTQPQTVPAATPNQFQSASSSGGGVRSSAAFVSNPTAQGLPADANKTVFLVQARIGGPMIQQGRLFLFGQVLSPPETDEAGTLLSTLANTPRPQDYWFPEPFHANDHAGERYFYSTNAQLVYGIDPGVATVTWRKVTPDTSLPSGFTEVGNTGVYTHSDPSTPYQVLKEGSFYYYLRPERYVVSGSPVKATRTIYWTEASHRQTGWPVGVPTARISGVNIVYNARVPERVNDPFEAPGEVPIVENNGNNVLSETRTLWFDRTQNSILAYNREGRVFMELLGDPQPNGTKQQLGIEIVDVISEPKPIDLRMALGERIDAFQNGRDDTHLHPEPIRGTITQNFAYRYETPGPEPVEFYAERETVNANDMLMHWLEAGEQGLLWPKRYARYKLHWPEEVERYQHYIRPVVSSDAEAKATAVQLPTDNTPTIAYQDPLDRPRAKLTEQFEYYTYLNATYPAHRGLIRLLAGDQLRYERVFSWLDTALTQQTATNVVTVPGIAPTPLSTVRDEVGGFTAMNLPYELVVENNRAYITGNTDDSLTIVDVSDPSNPTKLAEIRDGVGGFDRLDGAYGLAVKDGYAYVAGRFDKAITVIDARDPANPVKVAELLDDEVGGTVYTGFNAIFHMDISGNLLAVAGFNDATVTLIDISDPANPVKLSEITDNVGEFTTLHTVFAVKIAGDVLYIAATLEDAVTAVDISDPRNPKLLSVMRDNQNGFDLLDHPLALDYQNGILHIGSWHDYGWTMVDVSDPRDPKPIFQVKDEVGGFNDLRSLRRVTVNGPTAYLTATGDEAITIVDISDPTAPRILSTIKDGVGGFDSLLDAREFKVVGSIGYALAAGDDALTIMDLSPLTETKHLNPGLNHSVATNLAALNNVNIYDWPNEFKAPRVVTPTVYVGDRINAPDGELGSNAGDDYLAGHIVVDQGNSFHPAYRDPFAEGFDTANLGSIIPVNAIPGHNELEIHWFRKSERTNDFARGFKPIYWPSVVGRYTIAWPTNPSEIVLASNDGSGGLGSLEAKGAIYTQNNPNLPGYNPNEEHALMLGGQAFALRDDLNLTGTASPAVLDQTYSSAPFVLLEYTDTDGRISVRAFKVLREKASEGILFDYVTEAGALLQAPMPLPFLPPPVDPVTGLNHNTEAGPSTDLPTWWAGATDKTGFEHYNSFTYQDRKNSFWVYRGQHAGPPTLAAGSYNEGTGMFDTLPAATAVVGEEFTYYIHTSLRTVGLTADLHADSPAFPDGLDFGAPGVFITGTPTTVGNVTLKVNIQDADTGALVTVDLPINVVAAGGTIVTHPAIAITSNNSYAGQDVTYNGRPPYLAESPSPANSFTMRFYYKTQEGFAWPNFAAVPTNGTIVPYLPAAGETGLGDSTDTMALEIVYRPVWPVGTPTLDFGETLMDPKKGLPAVRGQTSVQLLYQQSIAADTALDPAAPTSPSVILHDPVKEKTAALGDFGLDELPPSIKSDLNRGKYYFPLLPPHLVERVYFDPARNVDLGGELVFAGEYKDETVGEKYVLLNVLKGSDLEAVKALVPDTDEKRASWNNLVDGLTTEIEHHVENPEVPGVYISNGNPRSIGIGAITEVKDDDEAVDSYALSAAGPGQGYVSFIAADGEAFTPEGDPISVYVIRVKGDSLFKGEIKVITPANPLSEMVTFQHTADLGGNFAEYEYEWKVSPPVDGLPPAGIPGDYQDLFLGNDHPRHTFGGAGIQALVDNYMIMRYRPKNSGHPLHDQWSEWTEPQLAEGWIKRVLAGINPFNQRATDLFNNSVNTDVSLLTQAGRRWEGDIALNMDAVNEAGLIEIYETVLNRGKNLSIDAGINFGPANDALLLAAGYINDLYMMLGNEAWADASNPTIGIGTDDSALGDIATSLFAFRGQTASLLEEELALLRGRDDFLQPGVELAPVYNRLIWNYTRGIDAGEVVYALNYNIQENPNDAPDGIVNAEDAAHLFPQGHGDAYGHYLTALKGYYKLLTHLDFDWVPRIEAVLVLGAPVSVDYLDERKFASAAAAVARTGQQVFDLTWRRDYTPGDDVGWEHLSQTRVNDRRSFDDVGTPTNSERHWGADHWASRTGQGTYLNWVIGNAILPDVDPDPSHEGIQKVDRMTVPELTELPTIFESLQASMDNAEAGLSPLGVPEGAIAFDINPAQIAGASSKTHFEQVFERATAALKNAVVSFDDAKGVTAAMRSEQNALVGFQAEIARQELAYTNQLIELYGTPYPDDIGPGRTYKTGFSGPDLVHYTYVETPEMDFNGRVATETNRTYRIDIQQFSPQWQDRLLGSFAFLTDANSSEYREDLHYLEFNYGNHGFFDRPATWTGQRRSPGAIQQAISEYIAVHYRLKTTLRGAEADKAALDKAIQVLEARRDTNDEIRKLKKDLLLAKETLNNVQAATDTVRHGYATAKSLIPKVADAAASFLPKNLIVGTAAGGDATSAGRGALKLAGTVASIAVDVLDFAAFFAERSMRLDVANDELWVPFDDIDPKRFDQEMKEAVATVGKDLRAVQRNLFTINERLRELDDARRKIDSLVAKGDRIQEEREVFRKRAAAIVQGYRTRDAGFRIFRNEKLERYKTLFDLAARYTLLAANAYDYETGQLGTSEGKNFLARIPASRALGVVQGGQPQFAGSDNGDSGLSSILAEMKADWDVLRSRLGFNNPDGYGTTVSLRTENFRILPGDEGDSTWRDALEQARMANILEDPDVRRHCLQVDPGDGLPVPGLVLDFSTVIARKLNLFGNELAAGDHAFSVSSFATKIHAAGIALEGYQGMDGPNANSATTGGSTSDPDLSFLDPTGLSANPHIYLIPVGVDSMRSPPLGDANAIRTWTVNDVTIPLPFNVGAADLNAFDNYQSGDSLSEPLFNIRKHQAFRPVSSGDVFSGLSVFSAAGALAPNPYTNRRLIGRSVWNSGWKIVIPGETLLNNPEEGLDRFLKTVKDIKIHFVTYSYAGN